MQPKGKTIGFFVPIKSAEKAKKQKEIKEAFERKQLFEKAKKLDREIKELDMELDAERVALREEAAKIPLTDWQKQPHGEMVHYKSEGSHQGKYAELITMIIKRAEIENELFPEKNLLPKKTKKN